MDEQQKQTIDYIRTHLGHGYTHDQLAEHLKAHGWNDDQVQWVFHHAAQPEHTPGQIVSPTVDLEPETAQQTPPATNPHAPRKYRVFRAVADTARAIKYNFVAFIAAVAMGLLALVILCALLGVLLTLLVFANWNGHLDAKVLMIGTLILILPVMLIQSLAGSLFIGLVVRAVNDGVNRHKSRPLVLLKQSLRQLFRLVLVGLQFGLRVYGPLLLVVIVAVGILLVTTTDSTGLTILFILGQIATTVWILIAALRYILVTVVAVLEPELSITKAFKRSATLLGGAGQWFVIKSLLLMTAVGFILAFASALIPTGKASIGGWVFAAFAVAYIIFWWGMLVLLYLNRRAVKG